MKLLQTFAIALVTGVSSFASAQSSAPSITRTSPYFWGMTIEGPDGSKSSVVVHRDATVASPRKLVFSPELFCNYAFISPTGNAAHEQLAVACHWTLAPGMAAAAFTPGVYTYAWCERGVKETDEVRTGYQEGNPPYKTWEVTVRCAVPSAVRIP